jgi:preprotein translocase subunit SecF
MNIVGRRNIWFTLSGLFLGLSLAAVAFFGLHLGVDFKGGTLMEVSYPAPVTVEEIREVLNPLALSNLSIQPTDRATAIIRMGEITPEIRQEILDRLSTLGAVEEQNFASVGPTIGRDLQRRAITALILATAAIILYLALSFRRVPKPVTSWRFGVIAVVTLLHDVLSVVGTFAVLGYFFGGFEVDSLFVVAALTVMGYSVHDTIVVFDRVRENLTLREGEPLDEVVNTSVIETAARSLNTSLTVILVLLALYLLGGATTRNFVLALMIGIGVGTYSSIFLASPLLVSWQNILDRRAKRV